MHDVNLINKIYFYIDAFEFVVKLIITQFRKKVFNKVFIKSVKLILKKVFVKLIVKIILKKSNKINRSVKVSIIYDFFSFFLT